MSENNFLHMQVSGSSVAAVLSLELGLALEVESVHGYVRRSVIDDEIREIRIDTTQVDREWMSWWHDLAQQCVLQVPRCIEVEFRDNMDDPSIPDEVLEFVISHPGCDSVDIATELGITLSKARQVAKELESQGHIKH